MMDKFLNPRGRTVAWGIRPGQGYKNSPGVFQSIDPTYTYYSRL